MAKPTAPLTDPTIEARISALEGEVDALTVRVDDLTQRLTAAEVNIRSNTMAFAALSDTVDKLSDAVTALETSKADAADLAALEQEVKDLEAKLAAYIIGVYPPNPSPPQQVAQDVSPDAFTFSDQTTGYIFTVTASGGVPDVYTYALSGPDAALFDIDASGNVSTLAPVAAGSYDISFDVTNDADTVTLPMASLTSTADAELAEFPTPPESLLPAQTLCLDTRVGGLWHVAASLVQSGVTYSTNVPGFVVGASLGAEIKTVETSLLGKGPTVIRLPAIETVVTQGVSFVGKTYWIGTKDINGEPTTVFTGATGSTIPFSGHATDPNTEGWIKDIRIGPTDAQFIANGVTYQQGGMAVNLSGAGRFALINAVIRNVAEVGLSAATTTEWLSRRSLECRGYDSEIAGCGTDAQEHNIYFHCGTFGWHRSITRDTRGSHAMKLDCERAVVTDSRIMRDTGIGLKGPGNHSAALNVTPACDIRVARNLFQHVDPSTTRVSILDVISRGNSGGGYSLKTPPAEDIESDTGAVRDPNGTFGHWASNSFAPGVSKNIIGVVAVAATTGATSISLKFIASEGYKATKNLAPATSYTIEWQLSDLTTQTITTTVTPTGAGTATVPVSGGVNAPGIAANAKVSIKLAADGAYDYRQVNQRYWRKDAADYWWDAIRDGVDLDLTKQDLFNTAYFQDNLILVDTPAVNNNLLRQSADAPFEYAGNQEGTRANLPFPPINRPGGASGGWNDVGGYGSLEEPLAGNGYPYYGRNGTPNDHVFRYPIFWADNGVATLQGSIRQFFQEVTGGTYDAGGDIRWLDSGGTLNKVISTDVNRNPLPAFITTTLSSQANGGSFTVQVGSIAGLSSGQKFQIDMNAPRGSSRTVHNTTINGAPSGNTVTMADALPMDVPSGSACSAFTKAGAKPANWIDPEDYGTL